MERCGGERGDQELRWRIECELRKEGWPEGKWEWRKFNELEEARVVLGDVKKGVKVGKKRRRGNLEATSVQALDFFHFGEPGTVLNLKRKREKLCCEQEDQIWKQRAERN